MTQFRAFALFSPFLLAALGWMAWSYPANFNIELPVAGLISTLEGEAVEGVTVTMTGCGDTLVNTTGPNGSYLLLCDSSTAVVSIIPEKNDQVLNGVSTFDLVLISKHILGIQPLDGPYRLIAADISNNGVVSVMDVILMRQLILAITSAFPNNSSWRFVPANHEFPDPENPWSMPFPERIEDLPLNDAAESLDFIAIKVGDVNGSAATSN